MTIFMVNNLYDSLTISQTYQLIDGDLSSQKQTLHLLLCSNYSNRLAPSVSLINGDNRNFILAAQIIQVDSDKAMHLGKYFVFSFSIFIINFGNNFPLLFDILTFHARVL